MKFLTISLIIIGIILVFNLGGITTPSGGYALRFYTGLTEDTSPLSDFKSDDLIWLGLAAVVIVVGAVGVRAGFFGSAPPIAYYLGTFIILTIGGFLLTDTLVIFLKLWEFGEVWVRGVATLIFIPLSLAYILSIKSFWEGSDG